MSARLGKYQLFSFNDWMGYTNTDQIDKYWLGNQFCQDPQGSEKFVINLLAANRGPSLETFLSKYPTKEFEDDREFSWKVLGSNYRNIPLVEARDFDGATITGTYPSNVGAGLEPFYLVFAEKMFADGETIVGNLNEVYQFRILDHPREEGTNYVYKVELAGGNSIGVPPERLLAGERFSVEAAFVEDELSRKVGDLRFTRPVSMRNDWSTVRIQYKVGGKAINKGLKYGVAVPVSENGKSKTVNMWMSYVELELEKQFADYKNKALMFGRSNRDQNNQYMNIGKSGNSIKTGAGLLEQIEVANTYYYNSPASILKLIENAVMELCDNSLDYSQREFIVNTGSRGALEFHKAMCNQVAGWVPFDVSGDNLGIVSKVSNKVHKNSLSAGYQFTEYRGPNGIVLKLNVDRFYDDPVRNKVDFPNGQGRAMSYRYDIMYAGSSDAPNIFKCKIKGDVEERGYQWGFRNPFTGARGNGNMSYDEDSATVHRMATLGICVLDPTKTISIIPSVLEG